MHTSDPFSPPPDFEGPRSDSTDSRAEIVCLSPEFGLDEFPSEATAPEPSAAEEHPADDPTHTSTESVARSDSTIVREFQPRAGESVDAVAPSASEAEDQLDDLMLENRLLRDAASTFGALAERLTRRLQSERRLGSDGLAAGPVTLVDVLESPGGVNWREAVGIVYRLCLALKGSTTQMPVLLEPRNVEITSAGDVRVLPGQPCSDPLVVQLGRLLRRMLSDVSTPPELRLLIAQATFELPIFESVGDLARALQQLDRIEDSAGVRTAFVRATQQTVPSHSETIQENPVAASRGILPARRVRWGKSRAAAVGGTGFRLKAALIAVMVIGAVFLAGAAVTRSAWWTVPRSSADPPVERPGHTGESGEPITPVEIPRAAAPTAPPPVEAQPASRPGRTGERSGPPVAASLAARERVTVADVPPGPSTPPPRPAARVMAAPAPQDFANRAAGLVGEGKSGEAAIVFDALVMTYPLYDPDPSTLTPESMAAFRSSRRTLLPDIATRDYGRAKDALVAGDVDGALDLGRQVSAMLDRLETAPAGDLGERVRQLLIEATTIRSSADQMVFNGGDDDVVPPRPLSRQFPAAPPIGVPPHRIGILDMVIGTRGEVEVVRLHTPLNRYHERMIVSAAKAWRYRPALKAGKPVRFRLSITINLPESGSFK